jgi:hypothetical protein
MAGRRQSTRLAVPGLPEASSSFGMHTIDERDAGDLDDDGTLVALIASVARG